MDIFSFNCPQLNKMSVAHDGSLPLFKLFFLNTMKKIATIFFVLLVTPISALVTWVIMLRTIVKPMEHHSYVVFTVLLWYFLFHCSLWISHRRREEQQNSRNLSPFNPCPELQYRST